MAEIPLLGQSDVKERQAADDAPQMVEADTAFLVIWKEGQVLVSGDLDAAVVSKRYPTPDDITGAAAVLQKNLGSERTVGLWMAQQQEAMKKIQQAQMAAKTQEMLAREKR